MDCSGRSGDGDDRHREAPLGRGLRRVEFATSDAHEGLEAALRSVFPGLIWNRCQAHFRRNVLDKTPSEYRDRMHELFDQMLKANSQQQARRRLEEVSEELDEEAPTELQPEPSNDTLQPA